jgi:hypothetical protein
MRKTRDANRIVCLIDRNVDALYADRKTYDDFGERNRILWDRAVTIDVQEALQAIFNARFWDRREN